VFVPENDIPELSEQSALQWFCKEICKHFLGRTAFNLDSFGFQTIFDPEIGFVHVFRLLAAGSFSILFDFDGASDTHDFTLGGTFRVQLLFLTFAEKYAPSLGHDSASVTLAVIVNAV
jgi:hypothetical protein